MTSRGNQEQPGPPSRRRFLKSVSTAAVLLGLGDSSSRAAEGRDAAHPVAPGQDALDTPPVYADLPIDVPPATLTLARMVFDDGQDPMGDRLFRTTTSRRQVSLNGWWDFVTDPQDTGEKDLFFDKFPKPETQLWIPGTWNQEPRYFSYIGTAWYRRKFDWDQDGDLRLCFSALSHKAKIWFDGKLLGEHDDSYLPCSFVVKNAGKGTHTIVISVSNALTQATLPKAGVDWFPYGGIDRPAYAESVPAVFIEDLNLCTTHADGSTAQLQVKVRVQNTAAQSTLPLLLSVDGQQIASRHEIVEPGLHTIQFEIEIEHVRKWSPQEPNLYSARAVLGQDDQYTRFGIRTVAISGNRVLLNGAEFKVLGVNRHDDHPDWGSAVPPHLIRQDVEIIKRLGANAVRIHYPVTRMFLDYCDQNGFVFLSEMPTWQFNHEQLASDAMQTRMKQYFSRMVQRDAGHPCVLYWSLGNEWPDPDKSFDVVEELVAYARTIDASRPITVVTAQAIPHRMHKLLDIICINWADYGWYDPGTDLQADAKLNSENMLRAVHKACPEKPIIITEFGGAESQEGWHSWGNAKWSEEFQARNVSDSGQFAIHESWIAGGCVWQYADCRSSPDRVLKGRLHGWNGKGIVDSYRNPKLAFYALAEIFRATRQKMVK